jgi:hypothetical protein
MKRPLSVLLAAASGAALGAAGWIVEGPKAGAGALYGFGSVGLSLLATWGLTEIFARAARGGRPGKEWAGPIALLVLKVPVLVAAWRAAEGLGPPAPKWFLFGLALVYLQAAAWALSQGAAQARATHG